MFSPRESYIALEHYVDHIADVVASAFRTTKNELQAELTTLRAESAEAIDALKHDYTTVSARLVAAEEKIAILPELVSIEAEKLFTKYFHSIDRPTPTPVNTPPAVSQVQSSSEIMDRPPSSY